MKHPPFLAALLLTWVSSVPGQQSASYKLTESVLDAGGHPAGGATLASTSFHVKLDSIGEGVAGTGLTSASFHASGSFLAAYPPPREITGLMFTGKTTLQWSPEPSVGHYEVYRDLLTALPGNDFGTCLLSGLTANTISDPASPGSGQGWFYLVTARNRLAEEGTKGTKSNGTERPNPAPCP